MEWNGTVEWNSGMVEWSNELIFNEENDGQEMKLLQLVRLLSILAGDPKPAVARKVTSESAAA